MISRFILALALIGGVGCHGKATPDRPATAAANPAAPVPSSVMLAKPIGITTAGGVFSTLIPAGQTLPTVHSETFGNATNGKAEVLVELSQQSPAGTETITSLRIPIPTAADKTLDITVTLTVSASKQMMVKTTVAQTATTQQYGPFTVE